MTSVAGVCPRPGPLSRRGQGLRAGAPRGGRARSVSQRDSSGTEACVPWGRSGGWEGHGGLQPHPRAGGGLRAVTGDPGHTPDQPTIRVLSSQAARARIVCAPGRWRSPGGFLLCTSFSWRLCLRRRAPVAPAQKHLSGPPTPGHHGISPRPRALGGLPGHCRWLLPLSALPLLGGGGPRLRGRRHAVPSLVAPRGGQVPPPGAPTCVRGPWLGLRGEAPSGGQPPRGATLCHRHEVWLVRVAFASLLPHLQMLGRGGLGSSPVSRGRGALRAPEAVPAASLGPSHSGHPWLPHSRRKLGTACDHNGNTAASRPGCSWPAGLRCWCS